MSLVSNRRYDFSGGLNSSSNPTQLADNELSDVKNVVFDLEGALVSRNGYTKLTSGGALSARKVPSLYRFYKQDGVTRYTAAFSNQTMYSISGGLGASMDTTAFTQDSTFTYVTFSNNLYYANGVDTVGGQTMRKWSGTGNAAAPTASPAETCKYLTGSTTARRLFAAGGATNPSRLYFSALGNAEDWTTANDAGFIDVVSDDGEPITAIREVNGQLVICKTSSAHVLTGADPQTFQLRQINSQVGCVAPYSFWTTEDGNSAFFLGQDGIYKTDGVRVFRQSDKITQTIRALSQGNLANAKGAVYRNQYWLAVASSANNDTVLVLDFTVSREGAWTVFDTYAIASLSVFSGEQGQLYFGDYGGHVYQADSGTTDNGVAVTWYAKTGWQFLKEPERRKKFKRLWVVVEPTGAYNLTIYASFDGVEQTASPRTIDLTPTAGALLGSSFILGTSILGGSGASFITRRVGTIGKAKSMMIKFTAAGKSRLYGYSIMERPKPIK